MSNTTTSTSSSSCRTPITTTQSSNTLEGKNHTEIAGAGANQGLASLARTEPTQVATSSSTNISFGSGSSSGTIEELIRDVNSAKQSKNQDELKRLLDMCMRKINETCTAENRGDLYDLADQVIGCMKVSEEKNDRTYCFTTLHFLINKELSFFNQGAHHGNLNFPVLCQKLILHMGPQRNLVLIDEMIATLLNLEKDAHPMYKNFYLHAVTDLAKLTNNQELRNQIGKIWGDMAEKSPRPTEAIGFFLSAANMTCDLDIKKEYLASLLKNATRIAKDWVPIGPIANLMIETDKRVPYPADMNDELQEKLESMVTTIEEQRKIKIAATEALLPSLPAPIVEIVTGY